MAAVLWGCQGQQGDSTDHPLARQLTEQVVRSCEAGLSYHKFVSDRDDASAAQDSLFAPVPKVPFGETQQGEDSLNYLLLRDLEYAIQAYYRDPYTIEKMDLDQQGDTLRATVKPKLKGKAELQRQVVVMSPDSAHLRYLRTQLSKSSWLYTIEVDISVDFDSAGLYQGHQLDVSTRVPMLGKTLRLETRGEGSY